MCSEAFVMLIFGIFHDGAEKYTGRWGVSEMLVFLLFAFNLIVQNVVFYLFVILYAILISII